MTAPSTSARQAAVDAALRAVAHPTWNGDEFLTVERSRLRDVVIEPAVAAAFAALAGDLFIARRSDGVNCVWRRWVAFPNSPQCVLSGATVGEDVWALLEAILRTRDEREA